MRGTVLAGEWGLRSNLVAEDRQWLKRWRLRDYRGKNRSFGMHDQTQDELSCWLKTLGT